MLELYHAGLTACSKKVRLCLKEKGLSYISRFININLFEQHERKYLELNPNGLVPTLVHDGAPIIESSVINEYLDDVFPEAPLRPSAPLERARMRVWSKLADEALGPNLIFAFSMRGGIGEAARALGDAAFDDKIRRFPLTERRMAVAKIARGGGYGPDEIEAARQKAESIVAKVEKDLETRPYLAGSTYSLADINMIPFIDRYRSRVLPDRLTLKNYPRTVEWHERIMSRPMVRETFAASDETASKKAS